MGCSTDGFFTALMAILLSGCALWRAGAAPVFGEGFEDGIAGWEGGETMAQDAAVAHGGSRSLRLAVADPMHDAVYVTRKVPVVGGAYYAASCFVKIDNVVEAPGTKPSAGAGFIVEWADKDGAWMKDGQYACGLRGTADWRRVECASLKAPDDAGFAILYLELRDAGTAWFDDIALERVDAALAIACAIACAGGQITIMVTDCVQGMLSYPIYLAVAAYLLWRFSWNGDLLPAISARPEGVSFLDPFDAGDLRDFNVFSVCSGVLGMFLMRLSWGSRSYDSAALDAHEAKMGAVLGTWRSGFGAMMFTLLAVVAYAYNNHPRFAEDSARTRAALAAASDVLGGYRTEAELAAMGERERAEWGAKRARNQTLRTVFTQMRVPAAIRDILPTGLVGLFCALALFLMLSTDTTYLHGWASVIVQDLLLPLRKTPWTPRRQIRFLRVAICGVAAFGFFFSLLFGQVDFILMFFGVTGAIWMASGPVITLGLYWRRGTAAAAFAALFLGAGAGIAAIVAQKCWASGGSCRRSPRRGGGTTSSSSTSASRAPSGSSRPSGSASAPRGTSCGSSATWRLATAP